MELKAVITSKGPVLDGKGGQIITDGLGATMSAATQYIEQRVKERTPQGVFGAQGGLISTIHGEVIGKGTPILKGIIGHQSVYGDVIEKGRQAGKWPPKGVLLRWIEVKLGLTGSEARRAEFFIRRKLGEGNYKGAHMFEKTFTEDWGQIEAIFERGGYNITRVLNE